MLCKLVRGVARFLAIHTPMGKADIVLSTSSFFTRSRHRSSLRGLLARLHIGQTILHSPCVGEVRRVLNDPSSLQRRSPIDPSHRYEKSIAKYEGRPAELSTPPSTMEMCSMDIAIYQSCFRRSARGLIAMILLLIIGLIHA